jgi:hypothetical protein
MAGITEAGKTDNQRRIVEDEDRPPGLQRRTDERMRAASNTGSKTHNDKELGYG